MEIRVSRPSRPRFFPPIHAALYRRPAAGDAGPPEQAAARHVLSLADNPFTRRAKLRGTGLDGAGRVARVLSRHQRALQAELQGETRLADFLWSETHAGFRALAAADWEALSTTLRREHGADAPGDGAELRARVLRELLIDTHCALFNGLHPSDRVPGPDERAFTHAEHIRVLAADGAVGEEERAVLLEPLASARIAACRAAGRWQEAVSVCADAAARLAGRTDWEERLIWLHFECALGSMVKGGSEFVSLQNARLAQAAITALETIRERSPWNAEVFDALGELHHARAVQLANGGKLSEALVEVETALAFDASLAWAAESRRTLVAQMEQLQAQMRRVARDLARNPNATLNDHGHQLQQEARKGFGPMNRFVESGEADRIATAAKAARAQRLWAQLGLPPLTEDQVWSGRALALMDGLARVFADPPAAPEGLAEAWRAAAPPELGGADAAPVLRFLEARLFDGEWAPATEPVPAPAAGEAFVLAPAPEKRLKKLEPLGEWLLSGRDRRVKAQAAAAVLLLAVSGGVWAKELDHRGARDQAYGRARTAMQAGDYGVAMDAAEAFLGSPVFFSDARREVEVRALLGEALVRSVLERGEEPDEATRARLARFRDLSPTR